MDAEATAVRRAEGREGLEEEEEGEEEGREGGGEDEAASTENGERGVFWVSDLSRSSGRRERRRRREDATKEDGLGPDGRTTDRDTGDSREEARTRGNRRSSKGMAWQQEKEEEGRSGAGRDSVDLHKPEGKSLTLVVRDRETPRCLISSSAVPHKAHAKESGGFIRTGKNEACGVNRTVVNCGGSVHTPQVLTGDGVDEDPFTAPLIDPFSASPAVGGEEEKTTVVSADFFISGEETHAQKEDAVPSSETSTFFFSPLGHETQTEPDIIDLPLQPPVISPSSSTPHKLSSSSVAVASSSDVTSTLPFR